ncbi:hypothetical protein [Mycobacterium asiaticum]|uniref:Uncharacterized protein n=1 Tax=Mycobacterium asiaticum TaxID=1790 RepID=A0A1A3N0Y8_MYCAS|nr:hypothetical protein [Mycobacterium asiaticum]OBK15451.1 hypothetical protein A5636_05680 [Mycobacterium asiaticum]
MQLDTAEQALAYLAQFDPETNYTVWPFEMGWVCQPILTPEQHEAGMGLGLANLVIDSQTGIVTVQSSLAPQTIAADYTQAKRTGRPTGNQIYPHQWNITIRRVREDPETIVYQMTAVSLKDPPEPTQEHPLTINKSTFLIDPADSLSRVAMSYAEWMRRQNSGIWPEEATTRR